MAVKILRFGKKEIFLYAQILPWRYIKLIQLSRPKFTIALLRTPHLSPYEAKFRVPLNFSKFDLRDYLFHCYNVRTVSIRSYIKQQPVRGHRDGPREMIREEAEKFMTIEMDRPFVWPEEPENMTPWGEKEEPDVFEIKQERGEALRISLGKEQEEKLEMARKLREQARGILLGEKGKKERGLGAWEKGRTEEFTKVRGEKFKVKV